MTAPNALDSDFHHHPFRIPDMSIPGRCQLFACAALLAIAGAARADYPDKTITFVVPFAAGSATDQLARALGQEVTQTTKQAVVVDDKPGASGFIGAEIVKKAAPDGYTVFITTNTTHAANEHLFKKLPYDPVKDYMPVTGLGKGGQIMIVNLSVPAKSVAEFIALAKAQPGKISFGSGSSSSRVAGEMFQQMAGIDLLHVPYKSNPLAINDLLGGQINMMITDMATGLPQVKGGKVRALGVSTAKRSPLAPDLPTISEAGLKGYEMSFWFAAYVPAHTPPAIVAKLHDVLVQAAKGPAMQQFYTSTGTDSFTTTPAELASFQAAESGKWKAIIQKAHIEPE
jgi:tripartite-type tricarboxylate transporter receptor subunit TctC